MRFEHRRDIKNHCKQYCNEDNSNLPQVAPYSTYHPLNRPDHFAAVPRVTALYRLAIHHTDKNIKIKK